MLENGHQNVLTCMSRVIHLSLSDAPLVMTFFTTCDDDVCLYLVRTCDDDVCLYLVRTCGDDVCIFYAPLAMTGLFI